MRYLKKSGAAMSFLMLCVLILSLCLSRMAFAAVRIPFSINVSYDFPNVKFSLYRVADKTGSSQFRLAGDFADYPVSLKNLDSDGWRAAAQTLEAYAVRDKQKPMMTKTTDASGNLKFTGISRGVYLVTGERHEIGKMNYEPMPTLIVLPDENAVGDGKYAPVLRPKYENIEDKYVGVGEGKAIECRVTKIWKDKGHKKKRPEKITAQLLKDGEIYKEVKLSKENGWKHTWKGLDPKYKWLITEKETEHSYAIEIRKDGMDFAITNTWSGGGGGSDDNPGEKPGGGSGKKDEDGSGKESELDSGGASGGSSGSGSGGSSGGKLPQTGQYWWPVPFLAMAGVCMVLLGLVRRRRVR